MLVSFLNYPFGNLFVNAESYFAFEHLVMKELPFENRDFLSTFFLEEPVEKELY